MHRIVCWLFAPRGEFVSVFWERVTKEYFISPEGKAYEEWDQIRDALGSFVYKSRRVETYEEYRDIIFGNNRGFLRSYGSLPLPRAVSTRIYRVPFRMFS